MTMKKINLFQGLLVIKKTQQIIICVFFFVLLQQKNGNKGTKDLVLCAIVFVNNFMQNNKSKKPKNENNKHIFNVNCFWWFVSLRFVWHVFETSITAVHSCQDIKSPQICSQLINLTKRKVAKKNLLNFLCYCQKKTKKCCQKRHQQTQYISLLLKWHQTTHCVLASKILVTRRARWYVLDHLWVDDLYGWYTIDHLNEIIEQRWWWLSPVRYIVFLKLAPTKVLTF